MRINDLHKLAKIFDNQCNYSEAAFLLFSHEVSSENVTTLGMENLNRLYSFVKVNE